ncbi:pyridoxamine kinase [Orbus sturtevantii]|uniref:pyridoxamine kinase n=1 Tax=Orbus sturtevantii TaxID=3074109 RepID=UPI00370DD832
MQSDKQQRRVLAVHDISCVGRCSLTVALPILSVAGIETAIIPTSILSTHTGGFEGFTFRDLTNDILPIVDHWQTLSLKFDSIYTGYLGSIKQLDIITTLFNRLKQRDTLIFVDPVMGDHGKLYTNFAADFPHKMACFCQSADIIKPNMTEAFLMLDEPYQEGPYTKAYIESLVKRLAKLGPKLVVLTGVYLIGNEQQIGVAAYEQRSDNIIYRFADRIAGVYHGTGDIFASTLLAALLNHKPLVEAITIAIAFTVSSIKRTKAAASDVRYGVNFEAGLSDLGLLLQEKK